MRIPELNELDRDQRNVYIKSEDDGATLITGPPGTGKTVLAFHRAHKLAENGQKVTVIMFNNVLARYSGSGAKDGEIDFSKITVQTMHKWFSSWYRRCFKKNPPTLARFIFDWQTITQEIRSVENLEEAKALDWGHLIVDEGQDFAPEMYEALFRVNRKLSSMGLAGGAVTVFADDNQSITKSRSTILQIRENLNIPLNQNRYWKVSKNYRNSREIAKFTRCFQVHGAQSAQIPETETGETPKVMIVKPNKGGLDQIKRLATNRPVEIGVIVLSSSRDVEKIYGSLKNRLDGHDILLQGYLSNPQRHEELKNHSKLRFDNRPSVTVLHKNSAKGLEFDVVYLMRCEALNAQADSELQTFRDLYVSSSRARDALTLCFSKNEHELLPPSIGFIPQPTKDLCSFEADSENRASLASNLEKFNGWKESMEAVRASVEETVRNVLWYKVKSKDANFVRERLCQVSHQQYHPLIQNYDGDMETLAYIMVETYLFRRFEDVLDLF